MTGSLPESDFVLPPLTLVIGGARSGKSRLAEALVQASGRPRVYVATAQAWDDEMAARIAAHRAGRSGWQTVEAPHEVAAAVAAVPAGAAVLVDCATLWLSNRMLAGADVAAEGAALVTALVAAPAPVVVVTNEVGQGIVPDNALARAFRDAQGRLNQALAAAAGLAVLAVAGLPLVLKGRLPPGLP
jgi:adenosylcobinamide kinase/adenosylcobinamide-phosphate guanylyltransferase